MGIVNREGALYMATGVDNSGLYAGRREAMGIIKAMASQITSFDVFSGIGISAATAFAQAAKSSYDFEKEFRKNMLEVATISTKVTDDMTGFMNQVMSITQEIPIKAPEAAKALYQIVSAGHDGADGMKILEVSAKSAVGGLTDTATAADAITTVLNAYKMSADEAANISDQLFTTVRLGKTTFGELGQSIAQVAPIAASYGVEIDQVLAAVASLTKQGTPTAQAMTQIRAAIIGTSKVLGDGAFESRTFQEALAEVAAQANGSESKLRELVPEIEAVNGVLGMTGKNAKAAASDLGELQNSVGATEAAFGKMKDEVGNQMTLLANNIQAALRPMGEAILKNVSEAAKTINDGFETGNIQNSMENLKKLVIGVAGAYLTYKSSTIGASAAEALHSAKVTVANNLKLLQNKITGESIIAKEKERIYQEAYNDSLEKTITEEQRAKLSKLNLKIGSEEYIKALSNQALQEKKNADSVVESLTKEIAKNKEKLSAAQDNLLMSQKAVEMAKAEFNAAFEANDLAALEVAQTKMNAAAKREEAAATTVSVQAKKLKTNESKLLNASITAESATTRINTATTVADTGVTNIATGAKNKLKLATVALWGVMKANPIGAILTAISLATTAYMLFADKIKKTETVQNRLNKLQKAAADNMAAEKAELSVLLSVAKNELVSKEDRLNAIKKLNEVSPEYLGNLSLENIGTQEATASIDAYTQALAKNAKAKAMNDILTPLYEKQLQYESELYDLKKKQEKLKINKLDLSDEQLYYANLDISTQIKNKQADKGDIDNQIEELLNMYNEGLSKEAKNHTIEIPVNIQIESEQANISALMKKKDEIENRLNDNKQKGVFVNAFDETQLKEVNRLLQESLDKVEALQKTSKEKQDDGITVLQRKIDLTKELSEAEANLKKLRASDSTATDQEITDAEKKVEDVKAKLRSLTGLSAKEGSDLLKSQQALSRSLLETELKLQSERLAIMQDGKDKRVLLADQEYKETLAAIQKERDEYQRKINEAKGTSDPTVLSTFTSRENTAKDKRDTAVAGINKEYVQEFVDRQKEISSVFLSEEAKRLGAVKDRYEKERKWAEEQHKTGGLNDEQYESYLGTIDKAEGEETLKALLDKYQDYDAQRRELERNYTEEVSTLSAQRTEENKAEVDAAIREAQKRHKEELANLDFSEFQESGLWKKMFGDLDKMALPTLQNILDKAKEVNTEGFTPEQLKVYQEAVERMEEAVRNRNPFKAIHNDWKNLMKALREGNKDEIANALAGIDQSVQKINTDLDTLAGGIRDIFGDEAGYAAEQVAELTSAIGGFATGASKIASGDILGGITSVVSSIGSIFSMGKKVKEMNRQAREEQQKFYDEARAGELEYQALLRERLRLTQQLGETSLQYFDRLQKELHKQSGSITEEYDEVWAKLMGEQYIEKVNYRHGTWFRKAKTWNDYGSLSGKTYEEIESLYTQNKLTDSAKILFEQLRKLKEEGADVVDMMDELNQSMSEAWTGTTEDAIAQSILEGIAAGKTGVDDLTGYFRDMMKKAMLQGVNMRYLQEPIKKFYEQFADMSESGGMLTESEIAQLQEMYTRMFENAQVQFENLQKISGLDFSLGEEETSENSLKGAYAKASQESIDLLAGQTGAQRVAIESIREQMQFIRDLQTQGWRDVATIKDLVGKLKEVSDKINITTDEIKKSTADISDHSKRTVEALESTLNVKVKM